MPDPVAAAAPDPAKPTVTMGGGVSVAPLTPAVPALPLEPVSAVARDIASDAAGQPRSTEPPLPPPGTDWIGLFHSAGAMAAIAAWLSFGMFVARPFIIAKVGEAAEALFEIAVWTTAAALGIERANPTLREK